MLARLRPLYNKIIAPLGKLSCRLGFSADHWTVISLVFAIAAGYMLSQDQYWAGLLLGLLMYVADGLDGATARASGKSSGFGTVFDHTVDRYAEFILIGGLLLGGGISKFAAILSISGMIMASYVRAKAESAANITDCTVGIAGRAEKLILLFLGIVFLGVNLANFANYAFIILGIISHITAIQRLIYTRTQYLQKNQTQPKSLAEKKDTYVN
jgi:phosphatidylglycerophosphate synthase